MSWAIVFVLSILVICLCIKNKCVGYGGVKIKWEDSHTIYIYFMILLIIVAAVSFFWMLQDMNIISKSYPIK